MRWFLTVLLAAILALPAWLVVSARRALDPSLPHTRATEALPFFAPGAEGLVQIRARGHVFRARVAGLANPGPAVLMLHGWPETSVMWEPLLEGAAAGGFRAAAFDQRGYSPGARFEAVERYTIPELRDDVLAIADALGFERFHLVGHDWGSIVGWGLTAREPERVLSWTSLSIPHPRGPRALGGDRGPPFYVRVFRTPGLAETLFLANRMWLMRRTLYATMPARDRDEYLAVFSEPGALTAAFDWYRALPLGDAALDDLAGEVFQPVLYLWGTREMQIFVAPHVREAHRRFLAGPYREIELDADHWLIQQQPDAVVGAVMAHLQEHASAGR